MEQKISQKAIIHYYKVIDSTMDEASKLANDGCSNYTVVVAEQQKSGYGRMSRNWISYFGGLYFSVIVRLDIKPDLIGNISFGAVVDVANTIRDLYGIDARLKWPNDILVNNHKICGILSQTRIEEGKVGYINLGIGINVNNKIGVPKQYVTSIHKILGRKVDKKEILLTFLDRFQQRTSNFETEKVVHQWKKLNVTLGKFVSVVTVKEQVRGLAKDLDSKCGLVVLKKNGSTRTVIYGDCFHS